MCPALPPPPHRPHLNRRSRSRAQHNSSSGSSVDGGALATEADDEADKPGFGLTQVGDRAIGGGGGGGRPPTSPRANSAHRRERVVVGRGSEPSARGRSMGGKRGSDAASSAGSGGPLNPGGGGGELGGRWGEEAGVGIVPSGAGAGAGAGAGPRRWRSPSRVPRHGCSVSPVGERSAARITGPDVGRVGSPLVSPTHAGRDRRRRVVCRHSSRSRSPAGRTAGAVAAAAAAAAAVVGGADGAGEDGEGEELQV